MTCPPRDRPISAAGFGWADLLVGVGLFVALASFVDLQPSRPFDPLMILVFLPVIVLAHEMGHAAVSVLVGHAILEMRIGTGPSLRLRVGRGDLVLGLIAFSGHVLSGTDDPRGYRWKRALVLVAGPAVNALLAVWARNVDEPTTLTREFVVANAVVFIANLIPHAVTTPLGQQRTDGLGLVRTLFGGAGPLAEERVAFKVAEAIHLARRGEIGAEEQFEALLRSDPKSRVLRGVLGYVAVTKGDHAQGRAIFHELAEEDRHLLRPIVGDPHVMDRALHLNNLAWSDLMIGDPASVDEADAASAKALELLPEHPALRGTRAFALIMAGRPGEGIDLGHAAYSKTKERKARALQAAVLAIGYAHDWRFPQAERWIALARRADPDCPLLVRAEAELAARRSGRDGAVAESG